MNRWIVKYKLSGAKIFHETVEIPTMWGALVHIKKKYPSVKLIGATKKNDNSVRT